MGEFGPVPKNVRRRRNKRPAGDKRVMVARPSMPRRITGEARAEWRRIVPELESMGLLALVDRGVLTRYCAAWADWCEVDDQLRATGKLIKGRLDGVIRNPLWLIRSDIDATLSDLGRQLGLSPSARLRAGVVHMQPAADEDTIAPAAIEDYRRRLGVT